MIDIESLRMTYHAPLSSNKILLAYKEAQMLHNPNEVYVAIVFNANEISNRITAKRYQDLVDCVKDFTGTTTFIFDTGLDVMVSIYHNGRECRAYLYDAAIMIQGSLEVQ